jgi:hypothetical protein
LGRVVAVEAGLVSVEVVGSALVAEVEGVVEEHYLLP